MPTFGVRSETVRLGGPKLVVSDGAGHRDSHDAPSLRNPGRAHEEPIEQSEGGESCDEAENEAKRSEPRRLCGR